MDHIETNVDYENKYVGALCTATYSDSSETHYDAIVRLQDYINGEFVLRRIVPETRNWAASRKVPLEDIQDWNFDFPRAGFVNTPSAAYYYSRTSNRQWRRGVHQRSILLAPVEQLEYDLHAAPFPYDPYEPTEYFLTHSARVWDLYHRRYPSFEIALETVQSGQTLITAFSDSFAVANVARWQRRALCYKTFIVGYVDTDASKLYLHNTATDLLEVLHEAKPANFETGVIP